MQWTGTRVSKRWWEQEGLELVVVYVEAALLAIAALEGGTRIGGRKGGKGVLGNYKGRTMYHLRTI